MNEFEQAVIDAAKAWEPNYNSVTQQDALLRALRALNESEKPAPVVFPDPPTNRKAWQRGGTFGETTHDEPHRNVRDQFRELRVTYTPMDEPSPAERISQLEVQLDDERAKQ